MTGENIENLVRDVVTETLMRLLADNTDTGTDEEHTPGLIDGVSDPLPSSGESRQLGKHLFVEDDIIRLTPPGTERLIIDPDAILTPAALDAVRKHNISIIREEDRKLSNRDQKNRGAPVVGMLSGGNLQDHVRSFRKIIADNGADVTSVCDCSEVTSECLRTLAQKIQSGEMAYGVVLDTAAFRWTAMVNRFEKIWAVLCWDVNSVEESMKRCESNILLIANNMTGPYTTKKMLKRWVDGKLTQRGVAR